MKNPVSAEKVRGVNVSAGSTPGDGNIRQVVSPDEFDWAIGQLHPFSRIGVDTETTGLSSFHGARAYGYVVWSPKLNVNFYFPTRHRNKKKNIDPKQRKKLLKVICSKTITNWNTKFDIHMARADGMDMPNKIEDIMLWAHLCNENEWYFGLKDLSAKYLHPDADLAERKLVLWMAEHGFEGKQDLWQVDPSIVAPYALDDGVNTEGMRKLYRPILAAWRLTDMAKEVDQYCIETAWMEERGMHLDVDVLKKLSIKTTRQILRLDRRAQAMTGNPNFNTNSSKQVRDWLGVHTSAADFLDSLPPDPRIDIVQEYRAWRRAHDAYYRVYLDSMDKHHVLHPSISLHGTVAGRPSVRSPALQAVPRYEKKIYRIKDVFTARPGYVMVSADYSQAELRLGAHYSKDPYLLQAFNLGENVHRSLQEDLTRRIRKIDYDSTKRVNFGILYGVGPYQLSKELNISYEEAEDLLNAAHARHPTYRPLYSQAEKWAWDHGYTRMWSGRVRRYNRDDSQPHKALSNLIQGGIAEMMRYAILRVGPKIRELGGYLLMQVHDQLIAETPNDRRIIKETVLMMRREMCDFPNFSVPFKVEIKYGHRWSTLKTTTMGEE